LRPCATTSTPPWFTSCMAGAGAGAGCAPPVPVVAVNRLFHAAIEQRIPPRIRWSSPGPCSGSPHWEPTRASSSTLFHHHIHAAIDGPVNLLADNESFNRRVAEHGISKPLSRPVSSTDAAGTENKTAVYPETQRSNSASRPAVVSSIDRESNCQSGLATGSWSSFRL